MKVLRFEEGRLLALEAPAKVNLYLKICSRRSDGYHEIETLMQKVDLVDRIVLLKADAGIHLSCQGAPLPENEGNLAYRAAELIMKTASIRAGVRITLNKIIPLAAGLGGGSSDAAAVLHGVNLLLDIGFSDGELQEFGKLLGADVPFFVSGCSAAWATGIGDCLTEVAPLEDYTVVLVNPGFEVSTRWVYENFALTTKGNPYILARDQKSLHAKDVCGNVPLSALSVKFHNDLEEVTCTRYPVIEEIKRNLLACGAEHAMMSGSGPTVFGIFNRNAVEVEGWAEEVSGRLTARYNTVFLARPFRPAKS